MATNLQLYTLAVNTAIGGWDLMRSGSADVIRHFQTVQEAQRVIPDLLSTRGGRVQLLSGTGRVRVERVIQPIAAGGQENA